MRLRVLILLAVMIGVIGLVFFATRKSDHSASATTAVTNSPSPVLKSFGKVARTSGALAAADLAEPAALPATNIFQRLTGGLEEFTLTPEQLAEYLRQYGTNVETLLATQRTNYIRLAAEMFPNDPRVQYAALTRDVFPEARREWLDRFKKSAPDNSIADYLSARDYLKAGDRENALKDLANAAGKSRFDDYTLEQVQNMEDAQLSAGRSLVEAKVAAGSGLLLPQLAQFKGLAVDLQAIQKEYIGAGDTASAETIAQLGRSLGQQLSQGEGSRTLIGQLVGIAVERIMLNPLPPDSQPAFLNGTVQQRIDEMTAFRQGTKTVTSEFNDMLMRANETEVISYFDRMKLQGEYKAMLWLRNRNSLR